MLQNLCFSLILVGFGAAPIPGPVGLPTGLRATNGPPASATVPGPTANPAAGGQPMYRGIPSSGFAAPNNISGTLSFQNASGSTGQAPDNADGFPYPQASSTGH
ncbi:hypothetical protein Dimus_016669 [Dionaea muscipula]